MDSIDGTRHAESRRAIGLSLSGSEASFDLSVDGYQFPGATDIDGEWLNVDVRVMADEQSWSFRSPCLLGGEIVMLIAWLTAIGNGRDGILDTHLEFMEPDLAFTFSRIDRATISLGIELRLGALPPWWVADETGERDAFEITIEITADQLREAASRLASSVPAIIDAQARMGQYIE